MPAIAPEQDRPHRRGVLAPALLRVYAHRESEELFKLTGQLAQPNQDFALSTRAAFFNSLKPEQGRTHHGEGLGAGKKIAPEPCLQKAKFYALSQKTTPPP